MLLTPTKQVFSHPPAEPPPDFQFCVRCHGELIIIPIKEQDTQQYRNHKICGSCGLPVDVKLQNYTRPQNAQPNPYEPPIVTALQTVGAKGSPAVASAPHEEEPKADPKIDAKSGTASSYAPKRGRREG